MKKLAICLPTYRHPEMIDEMLVRCLDFYDRYDVDLYVYDSSPDNSTEDIVASFCKNDQHIIYKQIDEDVQSNVKALNGLREIYEKGIYEYLWICPDYFQLKEEGLRQILDEMKNAPEAIILNYRDVTGIGYKVYFDINDLFLEMAWHMSSYPATIIRSDLLDEIGWEGMSDKYFKEDRVSLSHIGLYFEALAKKNKVKAIHIPIGSDEVGISSYRKDSMWNYATFMVWCEHWPNTVYALPDIYENKESVIRSLGINTGIFSERNFKKLWREGFFDDGIYRKYENKWQLFTDVPNRTIKKIAHLGQNNIALFEESAKFRESQIINDFCRRYNNIYLYGCGFVASYITGILKDNGIDIKAYLVTDSSWEKKECDGIPVIEFNEAFADDQGNGIIMAMNKNTVRAMMKMPYALWMERDNCLKDWQLD